MSETSSPSIEVVETVDSVPVPVKIEKRLSFLASHLGTTREDIAGKLLTMVFREDLDWQDLEHLRDLTEGVAPPPE